MSLFDFLTQTDRIELQLKKINKKLDLLISASPTVSAEQLAQLTKESKELDQKTQELREAIEKQQKD